LAKDIDFSFEILVDLFSLFRKEEPVYMFDQVPYPTTGITGHKKYREYSNPGFVIPSNIPRE
jgi:hypothetical protein